MAADENRSPRTSSDERTLLDSPDDTAPPDDDATINAADVPADDGFDATIRDDRPPAAAGDEATRLDSADDASPPEDASRIPSDDSASMPPPDNDRTRIIDPSVEQQLAEGEPDATRLLPTDETGPEARTLVLPADRSETSGESGGEAATMIEPAGGSGRNADATADVSPGSASDSDAATIEQGERRGTASGTKAESVPPEKSGPKFPNLDRFEILKLLGQGAFGAVYLAYDPHLDRKVAIKVAKTGVLAGKEDVDRFMREARSAAQLRHPNIVPVYEVGQFPNTNFIVYEFVEGTTLGDVLKERKKLSCDEAVDYMRKIASGLDYAHQHGIVHRDMKPDNVLIDRENEPHIADFGLARRDEGEAVHTREGMFMGTPSYMSPEQAGGKAHTADARSDVWSLGVMLQEMLTGVRPFRGNITEVLVAVQNYEPPALRTIDKNLPADVETIVEKCLTKDLDERYQSAKILADELERFQRGEPILARPISVFARTWRWMKRNPQIAGLLGAVLLTFLVGALVSTAFGISATTAHNLAHQQAIERAEAQLTAVRTADAASLPVLIESLGPHRDELRPQLMALVDNEELSETERSRVRLAAATLYPDAPGHGELIETSAEDLLDVEPPELIVRTRMLEPFQSQVEPPLWDAANDSLQPQSKQFAALAALASLRSTRPQWREQTDDMVATMLAMNPLELSEWLPAVAPIRDHLETPLSRAFTGATDPNVQYRAAIVLGELFQDTPETLIALVPQARPQQLGPLLEALKPRADFFAQRLSAQLVDVIGSRVGQPFEDEQANVAVNYALALLGLGRSEPVWPLLGQAPNEHLRTSLIHAIPPASISWQQIAARLQREQDPGIIAALCLTLGEYAAGDLLPGDRERLVPGLVELYRTHPHAGVHAAAEWVLRRWNRGAEIDEAIAALQSRDRDPALGWHVTPQGDTLAVIEPAIFEMGSSLDEPGEDQHRRLIPRTCGISFREVTVAEYMQFDPEFKIDQVRRSAPTDDCPMININWYDAAAYCRWLSEKEGFQKHEMCYPPLDQLNALRKTFGAQSLELPEDLLDRPGYRLPTAAEWEYAARGGTTTLRPFGNPTTWVERYAWYKGNGRDHTWPSGLLKPNNYGLFDIQGNAMEWCHNYYFDDPPPAGADGVVVDGVDSRDAFNRECRGGSNVYPFDMLRVSAPEPMNPGFINTDGGFRIARTYVAAKQAPEPE